MKRTLRLGLIVGSLSLALVGCGDNAEDTGTEETEQTDSEQTEAEMNYVEREDLKEAVGTDEYIILDVRKEEDYEKEHIEGAYSADQDAANKGGDDEAGIANLETALEEATGSKTGNDDDKYALVCYSGKSYAQKATDLMLEMGISQDQIYTLDDGMEAWKDGGDEYEALLK